MRGTKTVTDHEFLYMAIKLSPQTSVNFDFQRIGDAVGITKHSAYCRWLSIKKKFEAQAKGSDDSPGPQATETSKRKRATPKSTKKRDESGNESEGEGAETPSKKVKTNSTKDVKVKEVKEGYVAASSGLLDDLEHADIV